MELAKDDAMSVKIILAERSDLTPEVVNELLGDKSRALDVQLMIHSCDKADPDKVAALAAADDIYLRAAIAAHTSSLELLKSLKDDVPMVATAALSNPIITEDLLAHYSFFSEARVRRILAEQLRKRNELPLNIMAFEGRWVKEAYPSFYDQALTSSGLDEATAEVLSANWQGTFEDLLEAVSLFGPS